MTEAAYIRVPVRQGGEVVAHALVDDTYFRPRGPWYFDSYGYVVTSRNRRLVYLHREVLGLQPGDGLEGDHINGDKLDNREENLRVCTHAENGQNVPSYPGTSRYRGVHRHAATGKWQAEVGLAGREHKLGLYETEDAAAAAASAFRRAHMPFTNEERSIRVSGA